MCYPIIDVEGVFGSCITNIGLQLAHTFHENCKFDGCVMANNASVCTSLEGFAEYCKTFGVDVKWRIATGCVPGKLQSNYIKIKGVYFGNFVYRLI